MHSRLALFLTTAVVFIAGWYGQAPRQILRGRDLSASDLSLLVDAGAIRAAAVEVKYQFGRRYAKRPRPATTFAVVATLDFTALVLAILWVIGSYPGSLLGRYGFRFCFSRAPPRSSSRSRTPLVRRPGDRYIEGGRRPR